MINIRPEKSSDVEAIYAITKLAFSGMPFTEGDEPDLIDKLRQRGLLVLSLVADEGGIVVGQITFSPARISSGTSPWFALGPVSVIPERQGEGIGSSLINEGLNQIGDLGALGCILTGNPAYYRRFGFELRPGNCPVNEQEEHFMVRVLGSVEPEGTFSFHETFYDDA